VPLGDRQYAELQRRLRVIVPCPRCRLTFPYSAIGERVVGTSTDSTVDEPPSSARRSPAPDLVLRSEGPLPPQAFAPTADGPVVMPALETEGPRLTVVESGSGEQSPGRSLGAVWWSLSAPARWVIIAALVLSLGLISAAVVFRVTSAPTDNPTDSSGAQ
jgi:hypothetical protein